jgi:hypothetical protein
MNKVKVDNLHTLIHSLSPTEKRFFKRFLKGRKQEQNDYLRLFDELNGMPEYNREVLLKKISIYNFQAHLEVKKHYLFQLILDSLRQFRDTKLWLHNALAEIDILIEKGLYAYAQKRIRGFIKQAQVNEDFLFEIQLLQKEILLARYQEGIDINAAIQAQQLCYAKSQNLLEYKKLLNELSAILSQNSFVRNSKQLQRFERFAKNKLIQNPAEAKSLNAQLCYYHFNFLYNASIGENETCYKSAVRMHRLISSHPEATKSFAQIYLRAVSARFAALIICGYKKSEFQTLVNELKANSFRISEPDSRKIAQAILYEYQLIAHLREQNYEKALKLVHDAIGFVNANEILADGNAIKYLSFDIAKTFFITGRYADANKWLLKHSFTESKSKGADIYAFSRILSLLCDIFLNQTENVKYNAAYLRKQLSKEGALFEYEAFLLSRISNNFIHWNTLQKSGKLAILKRFKEELKQQLSSKWKANMVLYFDFDWWLDVQISRLA